MSNYQTFNHEFHPVYNSHSLLLILGTFPSVKSRENHFYYGHPQNRFWKVIANITGTPLPTTIAAKEQMLLAHHIAIWDVIESCDIIGSSDTSIRNVVPADIPGLLSKTPIKKIYGNGTKACQLYDKYILSKTDMPIHKLPSTSPANAAWSLERLTSTWSNTLF